MIPLILQLKNFLSYGDPAVTVDFQPYNFICLSGKNGHGKTALLDAITWALWGQARKVSGVPRADDALVRLGQRHMVVIFDFICQNQRYSVRRELMMSYGKPKLTLEFGLMDGASGRLKPLTEKSIRLTQERIQQIIGLDFDSFVNSVFLRQGQSNEFSKKTAQERKQILASILGLDVYEAMRKRALESMRTLNAEKEQQQKIYEHLKAQYARSAEVKSALTACEQSCISLQQHEQELAVRMGTLNEQKLMLRQVLDAQQQQQVYVYQWQLTAAQRMQEQETVVAATRMNKAVIDEKCTYQAARLAALEREKTDSAKLCQDAQVAGTERCALEVQLSVLKQLFERRKELYHKMIAYGNWVTNECKTLSLQLSIARDTDHPVCPLCEQDLTSDRRLCLGSRLAKTLHFYERRTARVVAFIKKTKELLVTEHARVQQLEIARQQLMQRENRAVELEAQVQRLTNDLEKGRAEHMVLCVQQQQLASVYAQQQQAMELVKTQHASALYADATYQQLAQQVSICQQALGPHYAGNIQNIERTVRAEEEEIQRTVATLLERKTLLLQQRGRLQQEHDYLAQVCEESRGYEQRIAQLERDSDEYAIIAQALGKDGIQALLIEAVVPEIEYEANELLARLSDQHARVFIESLRDLKGGGMRETLDIKIADNAGIRPYELFSGGEAFRVDFALRIAISKLLARRAGASLQTLIIDEGFGSQDEEGLGLVMETLYKIQDSFAKVIVVSHLSSMKDQFPVHFVVEKTVHGSQVRVIEQG